MSTAEDVIAADACWAELLGPVLTEDAVARLLGRDRQAISRAPELLRLTQRNTGAVVYPAFQFNRSAQVSGVSDVVAALSPALLPLSIASWLAGANRFLGGRRPIDLLRADPPAAQQVLAAARQLAASAG